MDMELLKRAWALLDSVTLLGQDCGQLCGALCCAPDEDGQGGVHLFPGERALIGESCWADVKPVDALDGTWMLTCGGACERALRPLGCRIFPLTPCRAKDGRWGIRMDRRAFAMCPLAPSGKRGLSPTFVEAVTEAVNLIARDPEGAGFLTAWAALEAEYGAGL